MASIPHDTVQRLLHLLTSLVSNDNGVRSGAETQLNNEWIVKNPDALLQGLAHFTRNSDVVDVSDTLFSSDAHRPSRTQQVTRTSISPVCLHTISYVPLRQC